MIFKRFGWLVLAFVLTPVFAMAETEPDTLVKNVTEEVLTILRQDKGAQSGKRQRAIALIENKVAPHFDFTRMTSLAVGRSWHKADAEQKKVLTEEFRTLLVRTYANALSAYRDQTVDFKSSANAVKGDEVMVHSEIKKPGSQAIALDYNLAKSEGGWKVFDVSIANLSLVTNYRSTFSDEVEKGGIDGLLKSLREKNRRSEVASAK